MLAALAMTALLQVRGAAPPRPNTEPPLAAQVAALRARWYAGLDAAGWNVDAPEARGLADELTAEAVALLSREDAPRSGLDRVLLHRLVAQMGGEASYLPLLERPIENARWLSGWLRWSGADREARADVLAQAALESQTPDRVAMWSPSSAGPPLRAAFAAGQRPSVCGAVLRLPASQRDAFTDLVLQGLSVGPGTAPPAPCVAAAMVLPRAQAAAAQALRERRGMAMAVFSSRRWLGNAWLAATPLTLAFGLSGAARGAEAEGILAAILDRRAPGRDGVLVLALNLAARYAPWLQASPGLSRSARRLATAAGARGWPLITARLRWRDPTLFDDSVAALAAPGSRDALVLYSARVVGAFAPSTPDGRRRAVQALRGFAAATASTAHPTVSGDDAARWVEALDATPCADSPCLDDVFERGSDERAAREVASLGGAGLAALPTDAARALVARVVRRGRSGAEPVRAERGLAWSATAWATFATVEGCPDALRGLREAGLEGADDDDVVSPWRDAFERACRDHDLRGGR
ncbi:MAG: hypothetical protein R3A48_20295 [Polyangiales bacterium]